MENMANTNSFNDLGLKKKLFAKSIYPMFSYHHKKKISEYGKVNYFKIGNI